MLRKKADDKPAARTDIDGKPSTIAKSLDGLTLELEPLPPSATSTDWPDKPKSLRRSFIVRFGRLIFYIGLLLGIGFALVKILLPMIPTALNGHKSPRTDSPKAPAYEIRRSGMGAKSIRAGGEAAACDPKPIMTDEEIAACRERANR